MDPQDKAAQFQSRIRAIYTSEIWQRLDGLPAADLQKQELVLRQQELQAMADTYLGKEYDKSKIQVVINFHVLSHVEQDELVSLLNAKRMTPERYLVAFNLLAVKTAKICEQILGAEDFERFSALQPTTLPY